VVLTSLKVWSWVMRSSILDTNFGARPFTMVGKLSTTKVQQQQHPFDIAASQ